MTSLPILMFSALLAAAEAPGDAVRLGPPHDLPSIGLQIALPARMTELPLDSLTDWVRAGVRADGDACREIIVLSALPGGTARDAKTAAGHWVRQAQRQRPGYQVVEQKPIAWESDGWEVLAQYKADDNAITSLQWFGRRAGPPAIIYVLTCDVVDGRPDPMRATLGAVTAACKEPPIRPAATQPVTLGSRQVLPKLGVSFQVPASLRIMEPNRANMVLRAGAVDYLRDRLLPVVTLTTNPVQPGDSAQSRLQRSVDSLTPSLRPAGGKILTSRPARVGGREAFEVTFSVVQHRERLMTAVRLTLWRNQALVLSLTWPAGNVRELGEAMEQMAASFRFEP
jgi:hypothetical protein